jgi:ATP-dependent exoDNAse (exonuclease V) beta subunit
VLTKEQVEKVDLQSLEKIISSSLFKDIKDYEILKEKVFLMNFPANMLYDTSSKESVLVQGVIDLLAISGDDAYIIDYKYSAKDSASLKATYHRQLELYSYAVEKVLGKKYEDGFDYAAAPDFTIPNEVTVRGEYKGNLEKVIANKFD